MASSNPNTLGARIEGRTTVRMPSAYRSRPAENVLTPVGQILVLQRLAGNRAVSGLLAGPAPHSDRHPRLLTIQRLIDPDYVTWRNGRPDTRALVAEFYQNYVHPEYERLREVPAEETLKTQMTQDAQAMRIAAQAQPFVVANAVAALNALILSSNAVSNDWDQSVTNSQDQKFVGGAGQQRRQRTRRETTKTRVDATKPGTVRGLLSSQEGTTLLNDLHNAVTVGLAGSNLVVGQVGVRGSSVTGIRSRTGTGFEYGTGGSTDISEASDHDFFFTCTGLDAVIQKYGDDRNKLNENGTMMSVYLLRVLETIAAVTNRQRQATYPWAVVLRTQLTNFTAQAEATTGRKSDVTYISPNGSTGQGLDADPSTVIR